MIAHVMRPPVYTPFDYPPLTQEAAIVMCGGGDPFEEYARAKAMCAEAGRSVTIFAGNDMVEKFPEDVHHAVSLHPDKFPNWLNRRKANGFSDPEKVWAHRDYPPLVTHWAKDWSGSTGLLCTKISRELRFVHVILCGVHMTVEADHFVRKQPWNAALGFRRGWSSHMRELKPYVRSFGGWTKEQFGEPTVEWLREDIPEEHAITRTINYTGLKA